MRASVTDISKAESLNVSMSSPVSKCRIDLYGKILNYFDNEMRCYSKAIYAR